ncbi:hypothetical protein O988_01894 [Pseudogymnoascus sp. VKM F-3808]|nr:hypothetical protein O988_01894 [Pseudogymnoascus sp. VKM F-3808]
MVAETPKLPMLHANIRQEIGIMIGFISLFVIVTSVFAYLWRAKNKRYDVLEVDRLKGMQEQGWGMQGWDKLGQRKKTEGGGGVLQHAEHAETVGEAGQTEKVE